MIVYLNMCFRVAMGVFSFSVQKSGVFLSRFDEVCIFEAEGNPASIKSLILLATHKPDP
jgi:hypothetical protein